MTYRRRRSGIPPKRLCPACGGVHYAWSDNQVCRRCLEESVGENRSALADLVRERRIDRLGTPAETPARPVDRVPAQGDFPDGF